MAPDVTVSIVHASQPELTLDCLDSLIAGDPGRQSSVEIVVLDNAAEDGLAAVVRERFEDVRLIEHEKRAGFGANHNAVMRETSGRYVFVLNPDTRVMPGAIDTLARYLDEHPEVAIVGPLIRDFDGRREASALRLMSVRVQLVWALTFGRLGALQATRATEPQRVGAVSGSAMVVRRTVLERVGGFDEAYFMYVEEADLARRLDRLGYERHYVPAAEVLHHGLASTIHVPEHRINEFWRSLEIYLRRYHPPLEARILRWLTGLGYAFGLAAATVGGRLPERMRPAGTRSWDPALYRLHVRNAFRGVRGPTLGTLAADWNRAHARDSAGEGVAR